MSKLTYPVISSAELEEFLWHEERPSSFKSDLSPLVNYTIKEIFVSNDQSVMAFSVEEQEDLVYFEVFGECCSDSWFSDIFCMQNLYSRVIKVEDVNLDEKYNVKDSRCRQEEDQIYGYRVTTMKGVSIISFRNSSNGYYGGECFQAFKSDMVLTKIEPDINGVWQAD